MTILTRYFIKQNIFLMLIILLIAMGIYILADFFERMNTFLASDIGFFSSLTYFIVKLPSITSQLLPAVFLIALVIQLNILYRNNEMIALQAGGISPFVLLRFILFYGVIWAFVQLVFSQAIGVQGNLYANKIWKEQVRGQETNETIRSLWFTEKNTIVHIGSANLATNSGSNFLAYTISDDGITFSSILKAAKFTIHKEYWELFDGSIATPKTFSREKFTLYQLRLTQDLKVFRTSNVSDLKSLPLWDLSNIIRRLQDAGSNVEVYKVALHAKVAYAGTILVMGLIALVISQLTTNIYRSVISSILIVFIFFFLDRTANIFGEEGVISPFIAAWFADFFMFFIGACFFLYPITRQKYYDFIKK